MTAKLSEDYETQSGEVVPEGWVPMEDQDEEGLHYEYAPYKYAPEDDPEYPFPIYVTTYVPDAKYWTVEAYFTYPHPATEVFHVMLGFAATIANVDLAIKAHTNMITTLVPGSEIQAVLNPHK